ncbi:hypothetical protein ACFSQJ_13655 [Croceitalea marina]|uniref:Uncharacterized protein n=1 Tax=Croceitalea marina TaxID=1775166 RepID=A0ABW5MZP9_9FLAO
MNLLNAYIMNSFDEIQSKWNKQEEIRPPKEGFQILVQEIAKIKNKQKITNCVLFGTCLVLLGFFFYISGYNNKQVILGLALMTGSLVVRIIIEILSIKKIKKVNRGRNSRIFKKELLKYYSERRIVHFVVTPVIVILYGIGFVVLLPLFEASLSTGFYNYIVVSSIVISLVLGLFIAKQIKKELEDLKVLKDSE